MPIKLITKGALGVEEGATSGKHVNINVSAEE